MKKEEIKKVAVLFQITEEEKKMLKEIAKNEQRTMSSWLRNRIFQESKQLNNLLNK